MIRNFVLGLCLCSSMLLTSAFASSFSELDLKTREALVNHFQSRHISINLNKSIKDLNFVTVHDLNQCEIEIAAIVTYQATNGEVKEYCNVCFVDLNLDNTNKLANYEEQLTYCL